MLVHEIDEIDEGARLAAAAAAVRGRKAQGAAAKRNRGGEENAAAAKAAAEELAAVRYIGLQALGVWGLQAWVRRVAACMPMVAGQRAAAAAAREAASAGAQARRAGGLMSIVWPMHLYLYIYDVRYVWVRALLIYIYGRANRCIPRVRVCEQAATSERMQLRLAALAQAANVAHAAFRTLMGSMERDEIAILPERVRRSSMDAIEQPRQASELARAVAGGVTKRVDRLVREGGCTPQVSIGCNPVHPRCNPTHPCCNPVYPPQVREAERLQGEVVGAEEREREARRAARIAKEVAYTYANPNFAPFGRGCADGDARLPRHRCAAPDFNVASTPLGRCSSKAAPRRGSSCETQ